MTNTMFPETEVVPSYKSLSYHRSRGNPKNNREEFFE